MAKKIQLTKERRACWSTSARSFSCTTGGSSASSVRVFLSCSSTCVCDACEHAHAVELPVSALDQTKHRCVARTALNAFAIPNVSENVKHSGYIRNSTGKAQHFLCDTKAAFRNNTGQTVFIGVGMPHSG
eukprot:1159366-Pelagomonas_calceolata.AAC.4